MKIESLHTMLPVQRGIRLILIGIIKIIKLYYRTHQVSNKEFKIEIRLSNNVFNLPLMLSSILI